MQLAITTKGLAMKYPVDTGILAAFRKPFKRKYQQALSDINITVKKGEIFGLLGTNGAGKTTLVKLLSTLLIPSKGTAFVNGYSTTEHPDQVKKSIGLINTEDRGLFWRLTARQNLAFFASLQGLEGAAAEKAIDRALDLVGLTADADKRCDSFSTGMKQRLIFARGILHDPDIIFMDEPTRGMDVNIAKKMRNFILDLKVKHNKTILLTTHNMKEAEELCDTICILHKGNVIADGSLDELRKRAKKNSVIIRIAEPPQSLPAQLKSITGVRDIQLKQDTLELSIDTENRLQDVLDALKKSGSRVLSCTTREFDLEDIFFELIA